MHCSVIRARNVLEGHQPPHNCGTLEVGVEDIIHVNGEIFGPLSLQSGGEPILYQGHEYCDHHNGRSDTVIRRG